MTAPLWFRIYALVTFPWSAEGSYVWWWRIHVDMHRVEQDPPCPWCA